MRSNFLGDSIDHSGRGHGRQETYLVEGQNSGPRASVRRHNWSLRAGWLAHEKAQSWALKYQLNKINLHAQ